jgi:hypothetical protein
MSETLSTTDTKTSKIVVLGLIGTIIVGAAIWSYSEFSADLMLDREKAKILGAEYEKRCQGSYEPQMCKRLAGMHHSTCMRDATIASGGDESEEMRLYLECMTKKEAESAL